MKVTLEALRQRPMPQHIAVIMDGNGRWAKAKGLPRLAGHRMGVQTLKSTIIAIEELGIHYLTVYAFSTENWKRPADEVNGLMDLMVEFIDKEIDYLHEKGVRVNPIGDISRLTGKTLERITYAQEKTKANTNIVLNVALNYGGRQEIIRATKTICQEVQDGRLQIDDIDEALFANYLYTKDQPDPDLLIRPSGELRVSNFLLWQIAYSEFWITNVLWPDFGKENLWQAIWEFQNRDRRYGGLGKRSENRMRTRIISAIVGLPVLLLFIYLGGLPFAFMVGVLATIGLYEFCRMAKEKNQYFLLMPVMLGVWGMLAGSYLGWSNWAAFGILITFCIVFAVAIFRFPDFNVNDIGINFLGLIYIGWSMAHLISFDELGEGRLLVLYLFVAIWSSDSGAYFVGRACGKHKMCPKVSPKKTWEGSVGGIITTVVMLSLLNSYFGILPPVITIFIAIAISIIGQIGDLIESLIKRFYGVKDSGKLIPGHGGVLDRFDSIMLAAPVMYYCLVIARYFGAY